MATTAIRTEIAGSVWKLLKAVGDPVAADEPLLLLESMKMEIPIEAPRAGTLREWRVAESEVVAEGDVVAILGD